MPPRSSATSSRAAPPPSPSFDPERQNEANKQAWNELYASISNFVWGSGPVGFLEEFLQPEIEHGRSFGRVLDAGTGEGRNLPVLLRLAGSVTACDASDAALAKIPAELKAHVRLVPCDLACTPFPDGSFDFILLCDTVETLPDAGPVLREMRRILAPGGALACNIPGPDGDVAGVDMVGIGRDEYLYRGRYFYRFFRDREVSLLFADAGLRVARAETMTWTEPAHPGFRAEPHRHCSRVYLVTGS